MQAYDRNNSGSLDEQEFIQMCAHTICIIYVSQSELLSQVFGLAGI